MELAEETELKLKAELRRTQDRLAEARADATVWRQSYQRAVAIMAIWAPPDYCELLDDHAYREYEEAIRRL